MPLVPLKLPPGMANNGTALETPGRWRDGNFVRWSQGVMAPIGGWQRITSAPVAGRVGGMLPFRDNQLFTHLAIGTNSNLYILSQGSRTDVTPTGFAVGEEASRPALGYSAAEYGSYTYGDERPSDSTRLQQNAVTWSMDTWGEYLVACSDYDGVPYVWKPATESVPADAQASPIPNAPVGVSSLFVTAERHLCLIAPNRDGRVVQWSDREDYTTWNATATNLAGELYVQTRGQLVRGIRVNDESLILGDSDVHRMQYIGAPLAYGIDMVGDNCGIVGPNAVAVANNMAVWMSYTGFFVYNGAVQPLPCDVQDWVYRDFDPFQGAQVTCGHNAEYSEIWWFFPTYQDKRNTRYVVWNYRDNVWYIGYLERAFWAEKGPWRYAIAAGNDGHVYEHDLPFQEAFNARTKPWAVSAPVNIGNGDNVLHVLELMPDRPAAGLDALQFKFETRFAPQLAPVTYGPFAAQTATGFIPVRFSSRSVALRVEATQEKDWRLGVLRANVKQGGKR